MKMDYEIEINKHWIELSKMEGRTRTETREIIELALLKSEEKVKEKSDRNYAIKLVERILFGILALFGAGTIAYLTSLLFTHK